MDFSRPSHSHKDFRSPTPRSKAITTTISSSEGFSDISGHLDSNSGLHINQTPPDSSGKVFATSYIDPAPPNSSIQISRETVPQAGEYYRRQPQGFSSLRVSSEQNNLHQYPLLPSTESTMSAVALPYDPRLEMGVPRSSYTWHGLDNGSELLGHDLSSVGPGSDASLTPPIGSRSITSSPPRGVLTTEQRELKRQRDQVRRDSKSSVRARRTMSSTGYPASSPSPPVSMSEFSAASPMPVYTTAPSQISLLAEPVTSVGGQQYIPAYATSPPLSDHGPSPMFSPHHYPPMPHHDYMHMSYSPGFTPPPSAPGMSPHYGSRAPPMTEHGMMYSMPPVLSSGGGVPQEANHVRVVQTRPKPQCWEHGCNGRQFSTFSNLLRHQREKSGQAAKATCPNCGAEFTRTTARNGHMLHDKCKQRRNSSNSSS